MGGMNSVELGKIQKLALAIDWEQSFRGRSRRNKHLSRVVRIATYLARAEGAQLSIVRPAAWLHDAALPSGDDYQYTGNKRIATKLLVRIGISRKEASKIAECIASHEGTVAPKTLEAKVVHDADVLEKSGLLGLIRHTWKTVHHTAVPQASLSKREVDAIMKHVAWRQRQLQTKTAKRISVRLQKGISKSIARQVVELTVPLAARDLITEQIVRKISPRIPRTFVVRLREQLTLRYLKG
jgi:HD domain